MNQSIYRRRATISGFRWLYFYLAPLACLSLGVIEVSANQDQVTLEHVKSSWSNRQKKAHAWDVMWRAMEYRAASKGDAPAGLTIKSDVEEVFFESEGRFVLDQNGRIRFDVTGRSWSSEQNSYVPSQAQQVFDGEARTLFFPHGSTPFPNATISGDSSRIMGRDIRILPIRMVYRTLDKDIGVFANEEPLEISGNAVIDGRKCVVIRQPPTSESPLEIRIYADVDRDYLPLRYESHLNKRPVQEVQIGKFSENSDVGWVPMEWTVVRGFDQEGKVSWSDTAHVKSFQLNEAIDDSLFSLEFPIGTWVSNTITKERYLTKEGQEKRPILRGEYTGKNYEELLVTESGEAAGVEPAPSRIWLILVNVVIVLALGFFVVRKFRAAA